MSAWSKDKPTTAGWWWWRPAAGHEPEVVRVTLDDAWGDLFAERFDARAMPVDDVRGGEWQRVKDPEP